ERRPGRDERDCEVLPPAGEVLLQLARRLLDVGVGPWYDGDAERISEGAELAVQVGAANELECTQPVVSRRQQEGTPRAFDPGDNDARALRLSRRFAECLTEGVAEAAEGLVPMIECDSVQGNPPFDFSIRLAQPPPATVGLKRHPEVVKE